MKERLPRKLAAILYADVVDYSRLTGNDEDSTHRTLIEYLDIISETVRSQDGQVMHYAGDAVLAKFDAVFHAVSCAVEMQNELNSRNAYVPEENRVQFRAGVNLGDVIEDRGDIYGDGVNVAARLESLSEPGGICVSESVRTAIGNRLSLDYEFMGEQPVKNIAEPVRMYRIRMASKQKDFDTSRSVDTVFDRPAVAVLPFTNMSGDRSQEYFADGLTEDIIHVLATWRSFPVIARNSSFAYKGKTPDIRQVAKELGARYVLEGSVRKSGSRLRITSQLIDASTGHHLWSERFDRPLEDVFDLQDEIAQRIGAIVEPELGRVERKRAMAKKPKNLDAWDYYQRGMSLLYQFTREGNEQARQMFQRALEHQPDYGQPFAALAYTYQMDVFQEHTDNREDSINRLSETARRAVDLDDTDSMAHLMLCFPCRWSGQDDMAIAEAERAVELNPSNALAQFHLGNILDLTGESETGIASMERGLQLNPKDPRIHFMMSALARAHLNARRYDEAASWARKSIHRRSDDPRAHAVLAVALAHMGQFEEANIALGDCERIRPGFAEESILLREYRNPLDNEHIIDGLRKAAGDS
jgi:adenylate cyclase